MANSPADNLVDELKNTFVKPVTNTLNAVQRYVPSWLPGVDKGPDPNAKKPTAKSLGWADSTETNPTPAKKSAPTAPKKVPKYHTGTDYVPKTGPAILKKGEAVLNTNDAGKLREAKMSKEWSK